MGTTWKGETIITLTSVMLQVEGLKEKRAIDAAQKKSTLVLINQRIGQTLMKY